MVKKFVDKHDGEFSGEKELWEQIKNAKKRERVDDPITGIVQKQSCRRSIMEESVILCVDDEDMVLKSLKRELSGSLGDKYLIETSYDGEDALELMEELQEEKHEIPLVISDHIMPGMKGAELLARIHEKSPKTLTIMLTGQADMEAVTYAINHANLYRYIPKPWERTDLILTVREALRRYIHEKKLQKHNAILRDMNSVLKQEVKARTAQLEHQKAELAQLNASKDTFFSIIAHDLRNPFAGLLGITDFIAQNVERFSPQEVKENVIALRDSTKTVYTLLENLLTWSRLQRGIMPFQPEVLYVDQLATHTMKLFTPGATKKHITLSNQIPEGTQAFGDRHMIDTVIRNLVSNALKFTRQGGMVTLSAQQNTSSLDVSVSDTGVGIPELDFSQIFRIDVKSSHQGTAGEEGAGLGLILCKELIEKNGGTIWVESEVEQGTVFTFRLPRNGTS